MDFFSSWIQTNRALLKKILKHSRHRNTKLYLVGGVLRDIILKRQKENPDLDFCQSDRKTLEQILLAAVPGGAHGRWQ